MSISHKVQKPVTFARTLAVLLLSFMGIAACYGGIILMLQSSGEPLGMPQSVLAESGFHSFFVPGLILFAALGLLSLLSLYVTVAGHRYYPDFIFNQGVILVGWIVMQVYLIRMFHFLQLVVVLMGVILIAAGVYIKKWR